MQLPGLKKVQPSFHIHFFLSFTYCGGDQNTSNAIAWSEKQASEKTLLSRPPFSLLYIVWRRTEQMQHQWHYVSCSIFHLQVLQGLGLFIVLQSWVVGNVGELGEHHEH